MHPTMTTKKEQQKKGLKYIHSSNWQEIIIKKHLLTAVCENDDPPIIS